MSSAAQSAQVFSEARPAYANGKQTELYNGMKDYAYKPEVQELLQKMCADLFSERPEKPLDYMIKWLQTEKSRQELMQ